ncbi:MAG: threonine/homoserine/homoserine lactone efflux protein [Oleiphilaceae bacterium]
MSFQKTKSALAGSEMAFTTLVFLFIAMVILAVVPGPGMLAVVARSMASGFSHGMVTTFGIVTGDFIFIFLAIYGLSAAANELGSFFSVVSYLGGAYLIWLGCSLWKTESKALPVEVLEAPSWYTNYFSGLIITLSNPKAILFYAGFFPAILDLSTLVFVDIVTIMAVTALAIGGTMLVYAYLASHVKNIFQSEKMEKKISRVAGSVIVLTGIYLLLKA